MAQTLAATATLAVDFGTSNSAAAIWRGGQVEIIPVEASASTLPTAVFFPHGGGPVRIGEAATQALIAGEEGRYMRALKSVLGSPLLHEKRLISGRYRTLANVITDFLITLKGRAEQASGLTFSSVVSGRPVHFYSGQEERDRAAQNDLRDCYQAAGFKSVRFLAEPEAAALAAPIDDGLGLIVDIGGGTSDFCVFERKETAVEIVASHGIRLGGTDFDASISMASAMLVLGLGSQLRRTMAKGLLPVPAHPFMELATWSRIPFLYNTDTKTQIRALREEAVQPGLFDRFLTVLNEELGHDLAFEVERGKISLNASAADEVLDLSFIERGLSAPLTQAASKRALHGAGQSLREALLKTVAVANKAPQDIKTIVLVGGSSLMQFVVAEAQASLPHAAIVRSEAFTAVVEGLGLASRDIASKDGIAA
ncbi:MAG: Hsp70 family protein [Pseudomonadota bacterium]